MNYTAKMLICGLKCLRDQAEKKCDNTDRLSTDTSKMEPMSIVYTYLVIKILLLLIPNYVSNRVIFQHFIVL